MNATTRAAFAAAVIALTLPAATPAASRFSTHIDNPWFPLRPGTTYVYRGVKDGEQVRDVFTVTHRTRVVGGVRCRVISDRLLHGKRVIERTHDYYAQDRGGTVWYFGEDTAELDERGRVVTREGTWHAGIDGARPGIFMPRFPHVGDHHFQEHYPGHAEDQFRVRSIDASITVPYGSYDNALRTREWTALEPAVVDAKYYARRVGLVYEGAVRGPKEVLRLVDVRR